MSVPEGQPKIAQRFNAGLASPKGIESRRDDRNIQRIAEGSFAPPGLVYLLPELPRLKPWAIFGRLSEATLEQTDSRLIPALRRFPPRPGDGFVVSKDIPKILGAIKCGPELKSQSLPQNYNGAVMRVQRQFSEEVKHRQAERTHSLSLSHGQNYVLRELRVLFAGSTDEDQKAMINVLEKSFRGPITRAVNREVMLLRRNGVSGEPLFKALAKIYDQHNLRDWVHRRSLHATSRPIPKIVCSEALV